MLATFAALAMLANASAQPTHVRFVVTGDDRSDSLAPRPGMDENGVNVGTMRKLVAAIVAEKADVLLFNGDTIGGGDDDQERRQYRTFLEVMRPLYMSHTTILTVRGNHEMRAPHASEIWRETFAGPYANPDNGPESEKAFTFFYKLGDCLFVGLDQFMDKKPTVNQAWLNKTLKENPTTHVFAFAHKMAFKVGNHTDGMNTVPVERDVFLDSLNRRWATTFFAGHDHLYDHIVATKDGWPKGKELHQVVVGTAGAPFYHGKSKEAKDGNWNLRHSTHIEGRAGYCLVDVEGLKVTVVFKAESATQPGVFEEADSFSYIDSEG